jgi:hypothetical protein
MSTVDQGLRTQIANIEATYGRPIEAWIQLVKASGLSKHADVVAMLKAEHGLTHGAAHRVSLVARDAMVAEARGPESGDGDPVTQLYAGRRSGLRPIHDALMTASVTSAETSRSPPRRDTSASAGASNSA